MGYTTDFKGILKFTKELKQTELAKLNKILENEVDIKDPDLQNFAHPNMLRYLDLELSEDFSGVEWDGSEKTYHMNEMIGFVNLKLGQIAPGCELEGQFECQGEDFDDTYILKVDGSKVEKINVKLQLIKCICPRCGEIFRQE